MNIALKEWASVSAALETGVQIFLFRKGGIVEADRGGFKPRHDSFLIFPTWEHQHESHLREPYKNLGSAQTNDIEIRIVCTVTDTFPSPAREVMLAAEDLHIWNQSLIDMRYNYRPDLPITVLAVRAAVLARPVRIPDRPSYAGCKSWVHLTEEIDVAGHQLVLSDGEYETRRNQLVSRLTA